MTLCCGLVMLDLPCRRVLLGKASLLLPSMGLMRSSVHFTLGGLVGVYVAQNYNVPDVAGLVNTGLAIAKFFEKQYRKSSEADDQS